MRNLKRVLALAMAMVMILGMMVIGSSAATYADQAAIDENYVEAVEILSGMGVFQGTGAGFAPKATLSRAEAAALIYRVITADVTDAKVDLYDYSSFKDVAEGAWYTGYITYAANGGYLKGYDGKAMPNDKVTGVQVLAIMLRAAGYGQNGEYEGAGWMDNILTDAQELGLLAGVNVKSLAIPATREIVAQLIFNAMTKAVLVTYTPALGYLPLTWANGATTQTTLGEKNFYLNSVTDVDDWGRPATIWFADKNASGTKQITEKLYAKFAETPVATYTVATPECEIAVALDYDGNKEYSVPTYKNGVNNVTATAVNPIDVVTKVGGQGTLVEVYKDIDAIGTDRIVVIDTYLAKVEAVADATYDAAGHLKTEATIKLTVYDGRNPSTVYQTNEDVNYTYKRGDYILVNAWSHNATTYANNIKVVNGTADAAGYWAAEYMEIAGYAGVATGKQTAYSDVTASSVIGGTTYKWASQFRMGYKGTNGVTYNVYTDAYGNEIGLAVPQTAYNYGVISAMAWTNSYLPLTGSYAAANLVAVDTTPFAGVTVAGQGTVDANGAITMTAPATGVAIDGADGSLSAWTVNANVAKNTDFYKTLYKFTQNAQGAYVVTAVGTAATDTAIQAGVADLWGTYATNDYTVYLVETKVNGQSVYNTYTGYKNVPSMGNVAISYFGEYGYVTYAYVDATNATYAGSKSIVFIGDFTADGMIGTNNTYKVFVDGVPTEMAVAGGATLASTEAAATGLAGVYEITTNLDGEITAIVNYFDAYAGTAKAKIVSGVTYIDGTVITNGADSHNRTGAPIYKIVGTGLVPSNEIAVVGTTAYCVIDPVTNIITAIYHF